MAIHRVGSRQPAAARTEWESMAAAMVSFASNGASVDFYGVLPGGQPTCDQLQAPVLGLFGEEDEWMPPSAVEQLRTELEAMDKTVETVIYPRAGHAFFNDTGSSYDPGAAEDAWRRT